MPSTIDPLYDELLSSPRFGEDPEYWTHMRTHLQGQRPRFVLMWEQISRHLNEPRETVVDVGCGDAFFLRLSKELGFRHFIGVDLLAEPSFMQDLPDVEVLRENFNADDFLSALPDGSADCVVSTEVLEHVYHHPAGFLAQCWRLLRPGGLLLLTTPNPCNIASAIDLLRGRSPNWGDLAFARTPKTTKDGQPHAVWDIHFREYPLPALRELVTDLPHATIVDAGFLASAPSERASAARNLALDITWRIGLGHSRLLSTTEYMVVRRSA